MEEGKIKHQFFKKIMASRKLVQAKSAFSVAKKRSILLEEGMRRLKNCSSDLSWESKVKFLKRFSRDLRIRGHTESFRKALLRRVVEKYDANLSNRLEGVKRMYRSRQERIIMKEAKEASTQKDIWFL